MTELSEKSAKLAAAKQEAEKAKLAADKARRRSWLGAYV